MGRKDPNKTKPFTHNDVKNRDLVIKMLKFEEQYTKSEAGQSLYGDILNDPMISLTVEKMINRITLEHFDFDTDDENVETYRTIFRNYYKSSTDYDKEVLDSVHYMRENKCVYYNHKPLNIGDTIPDCNLLKINGKDVTSIYNEIKDKNYKYTLLAAFSLS